MTERAGRGSRVKVIVVMAIATLLGVVNLADAYLSSMPPSVVATCWSESSGGRHMQMVVRTTRGDTIRPHLGRPCPIGGIIEKRRGEATYRVDGVPSGSTFNATFTGWLLLLAFGPILVLLLLDRRKRDGERGPAEVH
jgi:hypothetical protein